MKSVLLTLFVSLPFTALSMVIEKSDNTSITTNGETETITISGQKYLLWPVPKAGIETFVSIPPQYSGPMQKLAPGEPMSEEELGKVLEIHYKNSAFDFDTFRVRNLVASGPRYIAFCVVSGPFAPCTHKFRAGTWIDLETNGKNRLGGMTGFEPASLLITKESPGRDTQAVVSEQIDGRAEAATTEELRNQLNAGVTIESDKPLTEVMTAARSVLEAAGYAISSTSTDPTILYTDVRNLKLDSKTADCGKMLGMGYVGDKRTETNILIVVSYRDGHVTVQSGVGGIMRVTIPFGATRNADKILSCQSSGVIDKDIAEKIAAMLR
jgi:hypothetical protein